MSCSLQGEIPLPVSSKQHQILLSKSQSSVNGFVGAVIIACLLKVGAGGKRGIASLRCPDVVHNGVFMRTVELHGRDDAY